MCTFVRLIKLPCAVRGMTVTDPDGNYNVYINKNLSCELQIKTYEHEHNHIMCNDFFSSDQVVVLEHRADYKKG